MKALFDLIASRPRPVALFGGMCTEIKLLRYAEFSAFSRYLVSRRVVLSDGVWISACSPGDRKMGWMGHDAQNCSRDEMECVLEGHFAVEFALTRKDNKTHVVGGKKAALIWSELNEHSSNIWRGYLYDGLWTLAIALSQALGTDASFSHVKLLAAINNSSFEGVTDMGGWVAPLDATVIERQKEYISYPLFIGMSFLALIGISLALIFLFVNVKAIFIIFIYCYYIYLNNKFSRIYSFSKPELTLKSLRFIKMSSPNLNNLIIVGSMCTFASVVLLGIDTRILSNQSFIKLCYVKTWTLCLGFTLAFGSMFSKTWRVHSIFTNIRMDRKAIKVDSKLLLILAGLLLVDVVVLSLWAVISPFTLSITQLPQIHFDNKVIIPEVEKCQSSHSVVFQAILYAIKGILMILGCFLAWETRHVNVPALNDSKYIGMSVYNVVVMSILGLSISVILQERVNEAFALACFFIIFSTTLTLCLVFVPKAVELSRNPQGNEPRGYRRGLMKSVVAKSSQSSSQTGQPLSNLEWCFASGMVAPIAVDRDPLLGEHRKETNGSSVYENGQSLEWPWVDPEEPSTML
uniref:G_PROTEIN_RECEP_F3_4 domain-containing protein n=1 Tax=Heterorhabditis bacteriophora TaxID=37862 RepID=A0A1I7WEX2_HETBA